MLTKEISQSQYPLFILQAPAHFGGHEAYVFHTYITGKVSFNIVGT